MPVGTASTIGRRAVRLRERRREQRTRGLGHRDRQRADRRRRGDDRVGTEQGREPGEGRDVSACRSPDERRDAHTPGRQRPRLQGLPNRG